MHVPRRFAWVFLAFCWLTLAGQSAFAQRSIRVDAGEDFFFDRGESWSVVTPVVFTSQPLTTGFMPFALNFSGAAGPGQIYSYQFSGYPLSASSLTLGYDSFPDDDWAAISPYFFATPPPFENWDEGDWARGLVDTEAPYVKSQALPAMRFTWKGKSTDGTAIVTQVVFLDHGSGDFDIELNYGLGSFDFPAGGSQSLNFGPDRQRFASIDKVSFVGVCFRGGVGEICTPVPEPSTYALFVAGIALLGGAVLRRRAIDRVAKGIPG